MAGFVYPRSGGGCGGPARTVIVAIIRGFTKPLAEVDPVVASPKQWPAAEASYLLRGIIPRSSLVELWILGSMKESCPSLFSAWPSSLPKSIFAKAMFLHWDVPGL